MAICGLVVAAAVGLVLCGRDGSSPSWGWMVRVQGQQVDVWDGLGVLISSGMNTVEMDGVSIRFNGQPLSLEGRRGIWVVGKKGELKRIASVSGDQLWSLWQYLDDNRGDINSIEGILETLDITQLDIDAGFRAINESAAPVPTENSICDGKANGSGAGNVDGTD